MSTTDEPTTTDASTRDQLPDAVDRETLQRDRDRHGEYRTLMRLSPTNEAAACETEQEVRAAINKELYREEPRQWVISGLNKRLAALAEDNNSVNKTDEGVAADD